MWNSSFSFIFLRFTKACARAAMLLILLEYLWDVCTLLTFLIYPFMVYKKVVSKKKFAFFLYLCVFFYESQWSNTVFYALVFQFNVWFVYDMKMLSEPNAIGLYIVYRLTQFVVNLYDGYIVYVFYIVLFSGFGYFGYKNKESILEVGSKWNLSDIKTKVMSYLLGKLVVQSESKGTV